MLHKPSEIDLISALVRYKTGACDHRAQVIRQTLKGGYVSKTVERIDLTITDLSDIRSTASFVHKACLEPEVRSLAAICAVPGAEAVPDVVIAWASPESTLAQEANGFVSPFYPGGPLTFSDPVPESVLVTLARVHAHWHAATSIDWTWTFDSVHFRRQHDRALAALTNSRNFRATSPDHVEYLRRLELIGRSDALVACCDALPRCLAHGDMHPGNIVLRHDGSPVIIDWGNACVAPPMLDLANIIRKDSSEWRIYLTAYRKARGPIDDATCGRAYWWARAATGLQYLPWIAEHTAGTERMILQIEEAEARLRFAA